MAKFYGSIGYAVTEETSPGVWTKAITERNYYGDILRNSRALSGNDKVNDDVNISNEISIVSDSYAAENIYAMRYIKFAGTKWKIGSVEIQYPRLILNIGGVYNDG